MNATIVAVLLAIFVLGVLLVMWGRRGRKINTHPQCKWCGFDLEGVYPEGVTCPECGAGLKRDGAVRMGVRKRMPLVMALGVVVALLPLAPLFTVIYAAATGTNLAKYTPTGLLIWQTRIASPAMNKQIADELIDRLIKKQLDKAQSAAVADRVLEIQGDRNAQWEDYWGDLLERLNLNGDLSKDQQARFRKQAAVFSLHARPIVRAGDTLPITVKLDSSRIGGSSQLLAIAAVDNAKLGATTLKKPSVGGPLFGAGMPANSVYFYLYGAKMNAGWMASQAQEQVVSVTVPKAAEPGPATLTATLLCRINDAQSGWNTGRFKAGDPNVAEFTITQQVTVIGADAEPVTLLKATPASEKELTEAFKQMNVSANVAASQSLLPIFGAVNVNRTVSGQITITKPKTPFAFDVFIRVRGKEVKLGELASAPAAQNGAGRVWSGYAGANQMSYYFAAEVPNLQRSDKVADIVFRPSTKAALATAELVEIYGAEIVLKDFPLTRTTDGTYTTTTTGTATTTSEDDTTDKKTDPEKKDEKKDK